MRFVVSLASIVIGLILFITVSSLYLSPNNLSKCEDTPDNSSSCQKVDAIVAISGGKTSIRAATAIKLYENGWAKKIIFSGAAADKDSPSNAETMRNIAINDGVAKSDILIDEESDNTTENAIESAKIIKEHGFKSIILVTSGYHQRRATLEFARALKDTGVTIVNYPAENDTDWDLWWTKPNSWKLIITEFAGILMFYLNLEAK